MIDGSGSGKTNVLLNLTKHQRPDTDKTYLYVKDPFESKHQLLLNRRGKVGIKKLKNPKVFIDFSQTTDDVYEDSEYCNLAKRTKVLKVFHDVIADMGSYKKLCPCN